MRLSHVYIRDILGIRELEFEAGAFTLIEGPNGAGKSSVINAIKAVGLGGEQAQLLRQGANDGEAVLVFDTGEKIRKRVTEGGSSVALLGADGRQASTLSIASLNRTTFTS